MLQSLHMAAQPWQNFYLLAGGAAATLTGLMFLAVTFGFKLVTKETEAQARAFTNPSLTHFVQVFITASLLTIPTMTSMLLGCILLVAGGLRLASLVEFHKHLKQASRVAQDIELSDWLTHIIMPLICYVLLIFTGLGFIFNQSIALNGLAVSTITLLIIGIVSAWELLLWMALQVQG